MFGLHCRNSATDARQSYSYFRSICRSTPALGKRRVWQRGTCLLSGAVFKQRRRIAHGYGTRAKATNQVSSLQWIRKEGRPHLSRMQRLRTKAIERANRHRQNGSTVIEPSELSHDGALHHSTQPTTSMPSGTLQYFSQLLQETEHFVRWRQKRVAKIVHHGLPGSHRCTLSPSTRQCLRFGVAGKLRRFSQLLEETEHFCGCGQ